MCVVLCGRPICILIISSLDRNQKPFLHLTDGRLYRLQITFIGVTAETRKASGATSVRSELAVFSKLRGRG
jgi:hypothetical protein